MRAGADVQRRLRADLLSTALEGGPGARDALDRLGLAGKQVVVLAVSLLAEPRSDHDPAHPPLAGLDRVADALSVHLSASVPSSAVAVVGGIVFALLPVQGAGRTPSSAPPGWPRTSASAWARDCPPWWASVASGPTSVG